MIGNTIIVKNPNAVHKEHKTIKYKVIDKILVPKEEVKQKVRGNHCYNSSFVAVTKYLCKSLLTGNIEIIAPSRINDVI